MSNELAFVDTNVLVYAHCEEAAEHEACRHLIETECDEPMLCVTPQVLAEFYSVITNPRRVAQPYTPDEALDAVERLMSLPSLIVLSMPLDVVQRWIALCRQHPVTGGEIFDLQIVASMQGNGIQHIYAFNSADFSSLVDVEVLTP